MFPAYVLARRVKTQSTTYSKRVRLPHRPAARLEAIDAVVRSDMPDARGARVCWRPQGHHVLRMRSRFVCGRRHFSRRRRAIDGWYYDVAAFLEERQVVCESLWQHYTQSVQG